MLKMKWNYRSLAAGDFDDKRATLRSHAPPNGTVEVKTPTKAPTSPDLFLRPRGARSESLLCWERMWKIQRISWERLSLFLDAVFRWICTSTNTTTGTVIFTQVTDCWQQSRYHDFTLNIRFWILKVKLLLLNTGRAVVTPSSSSMLRCLQGNGLIYPKTKSSILIT